MSSTLFITYPALAATREGRSLPLDSCTVLLLAGRCWLSNMPLALQTLARRQAHNHSTRTLNDVGANITPHWHIMTRIGTRSDDTRRPTRTDTS